SYNLVALATGYQNFSMAVTVPTGQNLSQNITMTANSVVNGGVRDLVTSAPLSGATVRLEQSGSIIYTTTSNSTGNYSFSNVTPGSYNLVALAIGYQNFSMAVTVPTGQNLSQNIAMTAIPKSAVTGGVRDLATSKPLSGATVRLEQNGSIIYTTTSNSTGNYSFSNVTPGSYNLVALATYYQNFSMAINAVSGQTLSQNIAMTAITTPVISTPTNVQVTYQSANNQNYITWTAVTGATSYNVYWGTGPGVTQISQKLTPTATTTYGHTGVQAGSCYYYRVSAVNASGESLPSDEVGVCVPSADASSNPLWVPFYRLYKAGSGYRDHIYTTNPKERDNAVAAGWKYERVECSISNRNSAGLVPLYRLYHSAPKEDYFYTTNATEKSNAVSQFGYTDQGIAGYVYSSPASGAVALYRLRNTADSNHFYCTRASERDYTLTNSSWSFIDEHIACYVMPAESPVPLSTGRPSGFYGSVNTAVGAYTFSRTEASFPSPGPAIQFTRYYNSASTNDSMFGVGWSHSYDWRVYENENFYIFYRGDGQVIYYDHTTLNPLYGGVYDLLSRSGDVITITSPDKTQYKFAYTSTDPAYEQFGFYLSEIDDRYGNRLFLYYTNGKLSAIRDPVGRILNFSYDANGHVITITDPQLGRTLYFAVNGTTNNLQSSSDWMGNQTTYSYALDAQGAETHLLSEIVTPGAKRLVKNGYGSDNRLISQTDAFGYITSYSYDVDGTKVTDPLGNRSAYKNNSSYEFTDKIDARGNNKFYGYNENHEITSTINPRQRLSNYSYKPGTPNLTSLTHFVEGGTISTQMSYANQVFPAFPTEMTDPLNRKTNFIYDPAGNLTQVVDPANLSITKSYNSSGQLVSFTNKNGQTTQYFYEDQWKNLTHVMDPVGGITAYSYDGAGRRISVINARGFTTTYQYDNNDNLTRITNAAGGQTSHSYDENNNLISTTDPNGHTTTVTYDDRNQTTSRRDPLGNVIRYTYDPLGRQSGVTDENGKTTTYQYDANDNLVTVSTPLSTIQSTYDGTGNQTMIIDPRGKPTSSTYSLMDQPVTSWDPLGNSSSYTYYQDGKMASRKDPSGGETKYSYDSIGRLVGISYPDGTTVSFQLDNNGNITRMNDAAGVTTYAYDQKNRVSSVTDPYGKTVSYGYDLLGNRLSMTYPGGNVVAYQYDALNRLAKVTDWLGGVTAYSYDAVGNVTQVTNSNGTYTTYTYDAGDRLTSLVNKKPDSSIIASYVYTLDSAGNIVNVNQTEPLQATYTSTNLTYNHNDANQLMSGGEYSYQYDAKGNLVQRTKTGETTNFSYNSENLLTSITGPFTLNNTYNGMGHRVAKTYNGTITRYVLDINTDMNKIIAEMDANGTITAYYVYGLGLISRITPNGPSYIYHHNHRGDIIALTDNQSVITDSYTYNEFGKLSAKQGTTTNPFKFVGRHG
ncbi:MAG: carboxypeptidase regulatory-like domain-containing protein, partial [Deltaproteobacteria bacterium]|nr:carboxypeptidase regulatory-like domain-containing protein [Deltaproteobacteria bacterium]